MNQKILVAIMVLVLVLIVPLLQYTTALKPQAIPFVGMSLVYYANYNGETQIRTTCVLKYNLTTNCVTIRDDDAVMEVDVGTREVKWCSESWLTGSYVEYWIPTDIEIGSHVNTFIYDAVVIGYTEISVCGKTVSVWQLHASGTYADGNLWQDTWYYEKKTGLCVSAAWIKYDPNGQVMGNWGGHLASTNVALP